MTCRSGGRAVAAALLSLTAWATASGGLEEALRAQAARLASDAPAAIVGPAPSHAVLLDWRLDVDAVTDLDGDGVRLGLGGDLRFDLAGPAKLARERDRHRLELERHRLLAYERARQAQLGLVRDLCEVAFRRRLDPVFGELELRAASAGEARYWAARRDENAGRLRAGLERVVEAAGQPFGEACEVPRFLPLPRPSEDALAAHPVVQEAALRVEQGRLFARFARQPEWGEIALRGGVYDLTHDPRAEVGIVATLRVDGRAAAARLRVDVDPHRLGLGLQLAPPDPPSVPPSAVDEREPSRALAEARARIARADDRSRVAEAVLELREERLAALLLDVSSAACPDLPACVPAAAVRDPGVLAGPWLDALVARYEWELAVVDALEARGLLPAAVVGPARADLAGMAPSGEGR